MAEKKVVTTKFQTILKRSSKNIQSDRADRIGRSAQNAQNAYAMQLQANVDSIDDQLEQMIDLSASGRTTSDNRLTNFDAPAFIAKYNKLQMDKRLASMELEVCNAVTEDLFGEIEE